MTSTRRVLTTALACCLSLLVGGAALAETVTLRFVQIGDLSRMEARHGRGGLAKVAAVVNRQRALGPTVFVHAGDALSPSILSGIDKGAHIVDILNRMGLDLMVAGNHDFDFGLEMLRTRAIEAKFPILAANVSDPTGAPPSPVQQQRMMNIAGLKVGFFGVTTEESPLLTKAAGATFTPSVDTARAQAEALRAGGADLVVGLAHTPLSMDLALLRARNADLILSGHDETLLTFYDGRTALTESYSQGEYVVVTTLTIDKTTNDGKTSINWRPAFEIIDTLSVEPDPAIDAVVKEYEAQLDAAMKVDIGTTTIPLDSRRAIVRTQEAAIGNLIADAIRTATNAEIAITNGGGIRGDRQYPAGSALTRADIVEELPFNDKTVVLELTGDQLRQALENGFSQFREVGGRFPQISGMEVVVDTGEPAGQRVVSISVGGQPLDGNRLYSLATNNFLATGGDGYAVLTKAKRLIDASDGQLITSQVIDYIGANRSAESAVEGRIRGP